MNGTDLQEWTRLGGVIRQRLHVQVYREVKLALPPGQIASVDAFFSRRDRIFGGMDDGRLPGIQLARGILVAANRVCGVALRRLRSAAGESQQKRSRSELCARDETRNAGLD